MNREVVLIFGKTGSGKTVKAKQLIDTYKRKVIIDSMFEYRDGMIFYNYTSFSDYLKTHYTTEESFSYILRFNSDDDYDKTFTILFEMQKYLLVVEEAENYISPYSKRTAFNKLVRYGRHKSISILGIARRTPELSQDFQAQVNTIYSFVQTNPVDLGKMKLLGFTDLHKLKNYAYIRRSY